jgi:hypothetical protein
VLSVLLAPPPVVEWDADERRALALLADAGLLPRLRLVTPLDVVPAAGAVVSDGTAVPAAPAVPDAPATTPAAPAQPMIPLAEPFAAGPRRRPGPARRPDAGGPGRRSRRAG